ncbi:MAG TPA: IS1595 family transposase, partial [Rhodothermales bacterium]
MSRPVGGRDYPRNQPEFNEFFPTERACLRYLAFVRWRDGFVCPACGHDECWKRSDGLYLCCKCRRKTSPTAGTIFDKTRFGLQTWFAAAWHITTQKYGASALGLQRVLGLGSYETAWAWQHKYRRAMVNPGRKKLSGKVEVDETFFGGVKSGGAAGRGAPGKTMVVVAIEDWGQRSGRVRMARIPNATRPVLHGFILDNVEIGTTVITDGWWHYKGLDKLGYIHERRIVKGSGKQAHELLPHVHRVIALVKRWIEGTHQGSFRPHHLDYYLDEYTFRFNRRGSKTRGLLFYRLIEQAVQ